MGPAPLHRRDVLATMAAGWLGPARAAAVGPLVGLIDTFDDPAGPFHLNRHARDLGHADPLRIERRGVEPDVDSASRAARELVAMNPAALLAYGDIAARAALAATRRVPILAMSYDLIGAGLVASAREPGGNLTGVSLMSDELDTKRLELLIQLVGTASPIVALGSGPSIERALPRLQRVARTLGVRVAEGLVGTASELPALAQAARRSGAAWLMLCSDLLVAHQRLVVQLAREFRVPTMAVLPVDELAKRGGHHQALIAYGPDVEAAERLLVRSLLRVLRGESAASVPVEQPLRYSLVIDERVARDLGIVVPTALRIRADQLFQ